MVWEVIDSALSKNNLGRERNLCFSEKDPEIITQTERTMLIVKILCFFPNVIF